MWRSLIRLAPLAIAAFQWWRRRQQQKARAGQSMPQAPGAPGGHDARLP